MGIPENLSPQARRILAMATPALLARHLRRKDIVMFCAICGLIVWCVLWIVGAFIDLTKPTLVPNPIWAWMAILALVAWPDPKLDLLRIALDPAIGQALRGLPTLADPGMGNAEPLGIENGMTGAKE